MENKPSHLLIKTHTVFTEYFRRTGDGWVASDATISLPISGNRALWLFGDTHIDDTGLLIIPFPACSRYEIPWWYRI